MSLPVNDQMPRIVAVVNQKGGVGKTTTAINLGASLAELGRKVLIVDLDPQGNASTGLGVEADDRELTSHDVLMGQASLIDAVIATEFTNLDIVPSTVDLSSADIELVDDQRRALRLREAMTDQALARWDHILIDCPPSLNLLTVNAMGAAHSVLVPLQCEFFAMEGLSQLLTTVREIRQGLNPSLAIEGILLTMYDRRNNLSRQVAEDVRANLGDVVLRTVIPRNVRLSEAPSFATPVVEYDSTSAGSVAYRALAREMVDRTKRAAA